MSGAYYNEWEPYAAQWLRNLIARAFSGGDMDDFEVHPPGTGSRLLHLQAELVRERDRIADALRLLDDYRELGAPFPTYAQLMRALQG